MIRRAMIVLALVGLGWIAARAQAPDVPDFEVTVALSQEGQTTIECVRGCNLQWIDRYAPNRDIAQKHFTWGPCQPANEKPRACPGSMRIGGWIPR
jgi:hypothetical protein